MYKSNENQTTRAYRSRDSKWLITFIILGVLNHIPTLKTRMDINSFSALFLSPPRKCNKSSLHINAFVTNSTGEQMRNINYNRDFAFSCTHVPTFLRGCRAFSRLACEPDFAEESRREWLRGTSRFWVSTEPGATAIAIGLSIVVQ